MRKLFKDFFYNAIYQVFLIIVPFITLPYLTRVLGPSELGIYSIVNFTIAFIIVIAGAAMGQVGTRTIAKIRAQGNQEELERAFWGLYLIQAIVSLVLIAIYIFVMVVLQPKYHFYYMLSLPYLLSSLVDISWFFQGIAEFGRVVLRNTIIKLISVIFIFALVRTENDLWIYFLITSAGIFLGNCVFWISIRRYIHSFSFHFYKLRTSLIAISTILVPQLAMQVYTSLDKTILGIYQTSSQVAYYDYSQRIARIILAVVTSVTVVMMPKMASSDASTQFKFLKKSFDATLALAGMLMVVVMVNTKEFVPWFFGDKYLPMTNMMLYISSIILIIPVGGVFANQFALALKKDREFAIPVLVGAVISLTINFTMIPKYGAWAAVISLIVTESIVAILRISIMHKFYDARKVFSDTFYYILMITVSMIVGFFLPSLFNSAFINMAYKSIVVMLVYGIGFMLSPVQLKGDLKNLLIRFKERGKQS